MDYPVTTKEKKVIKEVFSNMASLHSTCPHHDPDSDKLIKEWLKDKKLGCFYDGEFRVDEEYENKMIANICSGEKLAEVSISSFAEYKKCQQSAIDIYPEWSRDFSRRSACLLRIATALEKQKRLFALMESVCTGKPYLHVLNEELPQLIKSFRNWGIWLSGNGNLEGYVAPGVHIIACSKNYPTLVHSWRIAPALAAGSTVILEISSSYALPALLLATIIHQEVLQNGVFAVCVFDLSDTIGRLSTPNSGMFSFHGNQKDVYIPKTYYQILYPRYSCALVFESSDVHSAVDATFKMYCFSFLHFDEGGCKVLVQDSLKDSFIAKLKEKFKNFKPEKCLVGSGFTNPFLESDADSQEEKATEVFHTRADSSMSISTFRTIKEGLNIFNQELRGRDVSVWGENLTTILEVTKKLVTTNVWVNTCNMYNSDICYESVFGTGDFKSGGTLGMYGHHTQRGIYRDRKLDAPCFYREPVPIITYDVIEVDIKHMEKFNLCIGGTLKPPFHGNYVMAKNEKDQEVASIPVVTPEDIQNAVDAAVKTFSTWKNKTPIERVNALIQFAKQLEDEKHKYAAVLSESLCRKTEICLEEVEIAVERIRYWACSSYNQAGVIKETEMYGRVLETYEPLGVIGIVCPDKNPLLSLISVVIPCVMSGNTVVVIPSKKYPAPGMRLGKILSVQKALAGVINLIPYFDPLNLLCKHGSVESLWTCEAYARERLYARRWFVLADRNWLTPCTGQNMEFRLRSVYCKNVWLPMGSIFG